VWEFWPEKFGKGTRAEKAILCAGVGFLVLSLTLIEFLSVFFWQ